jgi:hypothetical protein
MWMIATLLLGVAVSSAALADDDGTILEFKTMVGVSGPFVGAANPIRGIGGGGLPWAIARGNGELKADGKLEVHVRGLVLSAGPLSGTNPVTTFRAVVSCQTIDAAGQPAIANVSTGEFSANNAGDSDIEAVVMLPSPCIAPIVFVTNPGLRWFAATGF